MPALREPPAALLDFLPCATPAAWLAAAPAALDTLLVDHALCEHKAASTALSLIWKYPEVAGLAPALSKLAREELRHFEQVVAHVQRRGGRMRSLSPARYAAGLRRGVRGTEPGRLVDILVVGAYVEARSCERFHALAPLLDELDAELARYYRRLLASEARHFEVYLELARSVDGVAPDEVEARVAVFGGLERELIESRDDGALRFHSGVPG